MTIDIFTEDLPINLEGNALEVKKVIRDMVSFAGSLVVDTESAYKKITSLYKQAREWKKCVESKRKEMVEPFRTQVSAINDKAKEISDPLDEVINLANAKANGYQRLLEQKRLEEEEKLRAAASLFDAQDEVYVPPVEKIIRGEGAVAVTKVEKRFKVIDISKIPLKYLMVDERAVKQDVALGISSIEGIEIWEETTTQLRVR